MTVRKLVRKHEELSCALLCVVAFAATLAFFKVVKINHAHECEGVRTGRCGWAWCEYYDGSDYLHDFNF